MFCVILVAMIFSASIAIEVAYCRGPQSYRSNQCESAIDYILISTSSLSFITSTPVACLGIFVLIVHRMNSRSRTLLEILTMLSFSDSLFALNFMVETAGYLAGERTFLNHRSIVMSDVSTECKVTGMIDQFFRMATTSWSFMAAIHLLAVQILASRGGVTGRYRCIFRFGSHIYVWGLSLATMLSAFFQGQIGFDLHTCWLKDASQYSFYIPLYTYFAFAIASLIFALVRVIGGSSAKCECDGKKRRAEGARKPTVGNTARRAYLHAYAIHMLNAHACSRTHMLTGATVVQTCSLADSCCIHWYSSLHGCLRAFRTSSPI